MKRRCESCAYRETDIAPNKELVSYCCFHPPTATLAQSSQGAVAVNLPRPTVRPAKDFCSQYLADMAIKPH